MNERGQKRRPVRADRAPRPRTSLRRIRQSLWPPDIWTVGFVVVFVVGMGLIFTWVAHTSWWHDTDEACSDSGLACGLLIHVVGTGLVALIAFGFVFLRREAQEAARWRSIAMKTPEELFPWLPPIGGVTGLAARELPHRRRPWSRNGKQAAGQRPPNRSVVGNVIGRDELVKDLARDLDRGGGAQLLIGPTGSGKTMVLLKLTQYLAARGDVPVPVSMLDMPAGCDLETWARQAYRRAFPNRPEEEAEKLWRWLRRGKYIIVLVDDLEKAHEEPHVVVSLLEDGSRQGLRIVAASRPNGVPADYRKGCVGLDPLDEGEVYEKLKERFEEMTEDSLSPEELGNIIRPIVQEAQVSSTPYYFAIADVLADVGMLQDVRLPARDARLALLHAYREAYRTSRLRPEAGLDTKTREAVLRGLEAIAYARLKGAKRIEEIEPKVTPYLSSTGLDTATIVDYAQRLGILKSRFDGVVRFGHPTTHAFFVSSWLAGRPHDVAAWNALMTKDEFGAVTSLALVFANADLGHADVAMRTCGQLHALWASLSTSPNGSDDRVYRLLVLKTSAQIAKNAGAVLPRVAASILNAAADELKPGGIARQDLGLSREHRELIRELASVKASPAYGGFFLRHGSAAAASKKTYDVLWDFATKAPNYLVRRTAIKTFVDQGADGIETGLEKTEAAFAAAERFEHEHRTPVQTDRDEPFESLRAVALVLPSLRSACHNDEVRDRLDKYQQALPGLARKLTQQYGLESSIADGLKLDSLLHPHSAPDPAALNMLVPGDERAGFWFSRVLLLQAITRRPADANAMEEAEQRIAEAEKDVHPFVRETAKLCRKALDGSSRKRYVAENMTEVAAGEIGNLHISSKQLIGDMVLLLNMNEHRPDEARIKFGGATELPHCLTRSQDRLEIVGWKKPNSDCPLRHSGRCLCPYTFNPPPQGIRRELSRAFCRDQRLHAKALDYNEIGKEQLREFWGKMEHLARY